MNESNLFLRIEGYAQENFTTETLAYMLETDATIRNGFLDLLLSGRRKLRRSFRSCKIETQPSFDLGRPDLEITSTFGHGAKIFVEVKTQSQEGEAQVRKYLSLGYVAYLTPLGFDAPDLDGKNEAYLGQFFWHTVHSVIKHAGSGNVLQRQFLKYLEARNMGPPEPISKKDLRASAHAADVIRKFQALIEGVRKQIEHDWVHEFGKNIGGKKIDWGLATGDLPYWWFRPKGWVRPGRRMFLCIGVYAEKGRQEEPRFYLELGTSQKKFGNVLDSDKKFRALCKQIGWRTDVIPTEWECYKTFPLGTGNVDEVAKRQVENIRSLRKEVRRLVTLAKSRL
jgi:hypothetical protein